MPDEVYYRILFKDQRIQIVCLQSFDEIDYDPTRWLTEEKFFESRGGERAAFDFLVKQKDNEKVPGKIKAAIEQFLGDDPRSYTNCLDC